jgi:arylsulfatase
LQHSARTSWIYVDGENFLGARADIGGDPKEPWVHIAWKYLYTAKDSWLGAEANLGSIGASYNLTMDPYEKYDMTFNGAAPTRVLSSSPGKYSGQDNGWVLALVAPVIVDFDKSIMKYPSIKRYPGGASNDLVPNLQRPDNPVPLLKSGKEVHNVGGSD